MKVVLMNKNTKVLAAEYLENVSVFSEIFEVFDINYAPLIIKKTIYSFGYTN
ncbi:MAG: hypothetical protein RSB41_03580 [Bacilli bacterium]